MRAYICTKYPAPSSESPRAGGGKGWHVRKRVYIRVVLLGERESRAVKRLGLLSLSMDGWDVSRYSIAGMYNKSFRGRQLTDCRKIKFERGMNIERVNF